MHPDQRKRERKITVTYFSKRRLRKNVLTELGIHVGARIRKQDPIRRRTLVNE